MNRKTPGCRAWLMGLVLLVPASGAAARFETPATLREGTYACVEGHIGHSMVGIPGSVPPHDFYIKLGKPTYAQRKNGALTEATTLLFMRTPKSLAVKTNATVCGRVDIVPTSSVETGKLANNIFLTGLTRVSEGEPRYDGRTFFNHRNMQLPMAAVPPLHGIAAGPERYIVVDVLAGVFFVAEYDHHTLRDNNPFRGVVAVPFAAPTPADQSIDRSRLHTLPLYYYGNAPAAATLLLDAEEGKIYFIDRVGTVQSVGDVQRVLHGHR